MTPEPLAWNDLIGFALGVLRMSPEGFWRMTLRELALAIAAVNPAAGMALPRPALAALMARFPDTQSSELSHG